MKTTWAREQQKAMMEELRQAIATKRDVEDILNTAGRCLIAGCNRRTVGNIVKKATGRE